MHSLIEKLLENPNVYEESEYRDYFESGRAGDPEYGLSPEDIEQLEYTLSYAGELLIGIDFKERDIVFVGKLDWNLQSFMRDDSYNSDEKFESSVEKIVTVLRQDYVNIGAFRIYSYNSESDSICTLKIEEDVFELTESEPDEFDHSILNQVVGVYGADLNGLDVIFESEFGEWITRYYVFGSGAIKVASRINQGSVDIISSEFTPLVCEDHWIEYIRMVVDGEQNRVVYTSENSKVDLTSNLI